MTCLLLVAMLASSTAEQSPQARPAIEITAGDMTQELELNDGSSVIGRVVSAGNERFVFRTASGVEMTVEVSAVRSLKPITGRVVNGELWREDPNPTRLFFGPTGRSLKKGEVYFGVYEVLLPFVQVGITDRLSIGAGTPLLFGDFERPYWFTAEIPGAAAGFHVSVGRRDALSQHRRQREYRHRVRRGHARQRGHGCIGSAPAMPTRAGTTTVVVTATMQDLLW